MPASPKPDRPTPASVDDAPEASRSLLAEVTAVSPTGHPLILHAQLADAFSAVALVVFTASFANYAGTERDAALRPAAVGV